MTMRHFLGAIKQAGSQFINDDCMSSGAAIAYYAIFALPPLMVVIFGVATRLGVSEDQIERVAMQQLGMPVSTSAVISGNTENGSPTECARDVVAQQNPSQRDGFGVAGRVFGVAILLFTATGTFFPVAVIVEPSLESRARS